jgi:hypothetical protein
MPMPDAAAFAPHMQDDASDDADGDATADAPDAGGADRADADGPNDAAKDACDDDTHDGSSDDVSVDGAGPDAPEDAVADRDVSGDVAADVMDASPPPMPDASSPDAARPDVATDTATDMGTSDEPRIVQSCYIRPAPTGVVTECAPVGTGAEGSACNDSHDCGPLLVCVEVDQKTACRAVYCALPPVCLRGTYYQEAPLRVNGLTRLDINVPVCLPVDKCTLLAQPNPCPAGKVCAVVGSEGDTTCLPPGPAKLGEPCDETDRCGEGLLCSRSNQCVKICHIASSESCPTGTCQGGNRSLPDGFGICVGQTDGG